MHLQQQASMKKGFLDLLCLLPFSQDFRICSAYVQDTASGLCEYH